MEKEINIKIIGTLTPEVGVAEQYTVKKENEPFEIQPITLGSDWNDPEIKWFVHVRDAGKWRFIDDGKKIGKTVDFTFSEISQDWEEVVIIVHAYGAKDMINIKTQPAAKPKITFIELLDVHKNTPKKAFAYGNWIIARVHCVGMELRPIVVTLWEDDGNDKKNIKIELKNRFIERGFVDARFYLNPMHADLANSKADKGESDEGQFHEYYITAEIEGKAKSQISTENTTVANPLYLEKKLAVKNEISTDIQQQVINSLMMVDVSGEDPDGVWTKKEDTCVCKDFNFHWSNQLTCNERKKVLDVCANLWGEANKKQKASELMSIIHLETAGTFKPSTDNGVDFSGLIQFSDASAKSLGTTRAKLRAMSFIDQMKYVEEYFFKKRALLTTMTDLYLLVLKPNAVGKGSDPTYVVFDENISVPDGDGSNTSSEQRKINIGKEPWVTKYGYASNPSFMKGAEHTQRKKWVYLRQRFEDRYGFIGGKTTVAEVTSELLEKHYNPGANQLFQGECPNRLEEKNKKNSNERAPWMEIAWEEFEKYKGLKEEDSPLKEKIKEYFNEAGYDGDYRGAWCASFVNWCFNKTSLYKNTNSKGAIGARDWGIEGNKYIVGSGKDGWPNGEITDAFIGAVAVIKSHSHVVFIIGLNSKGDYVNLGGNQGSNVTGKQKICLGSMPKSDVLYIMKPKNYIVQEEEKKLPFYDIDEINNSKSTR
ncbi:C40 family peptidase [Flavobacterium hercynium]|uniref:Peptidase C51 domain-containing protein n=1 Tax=Flavobacterium hercynium TaxID=387094 RepID=A0A226GQ85_9FLAO|nr:hypothetical protein [Flavobacterium hercynium]OXA83708.1 hypothetical protein B0A66_22105 [Flavobacterium hercynium]SMP37541.1 hypothetical protein SAMN06265346_1374 [Flavobacterium hercynium]